MSNENNTTVVLYGKEIPASCFIDQIYDPDVDGSDPNASGKYILTPGSHCTDRATGILYYVSAVDPTTFKHTILPSRILVTDAEQGTAIVSYGNDRFMLYYDDRLRPTKCYVDSKLIVAGRDNVEYRLSRLAADGSVEYISQYLDADEQYRGDRVPMAVVSGTAFKFPTNCHTLKTLQDGEIITLEIFNTLGNLTAKVSLMAMRATVLNDLANDANPIVKFDMECVQMRGEDFYVHPKQDPEHLNIMPYVVYADGTKKYVPVDNKVCFLYGLGDYSPAYPGYKQPLMAKLFLAPRELSTVGVDAGRYHYITCVRNLIVLSNQNTCYAKLSAIPMWNKTQQKYELRWLAYLNTRDQVHDVTDMVTDVGPTPFDGASYTGQVQKVTVSMDLASLINADDPIIHVQTVFITLNQPLRYDRYLFKDGISDDYCYGVESSAFRRPVIHYDELLTQYFIPSTIFGNVDAVLQNFYYNARPLFNPSTETRGPTPTHFVVRDVTGNMITSAPIPMEQYTQAWSIITPGNASQYVGGTVVVEFLVAKGEHQWEIIYGVPVEVYRSTTGYNTETNN